MNQTPNPEILKKIKETIKRETPHSRLYGAFVFYLKAGAVLVLAFISTFALSIFLSDVIEKITESGFSEASFMAQALNFLFDLLIIAALGIAGIYLLYRHTDWPFVKERLALVVGSFLTIAIISAALVALSELETTPFGNFLDETGSVVEDWLPFQAFLRSLDSDETLPWQGTITTIEEDGADYQITVDGSEGARRFKMERRFWPQYVGDEILLHYQQEGDTFDIEDIKKI